MISSHNTLEWYIVKYDYAYSEVAPEPIPTVNSNQTSKRHCVCVGSRKLSGEHGKHIQGQKIGVGTEFS